MATKNIEQYYLHRFAGNVAVLKSFDTTGYGSSVICFCKEKGTYVYDPTSAETPDDDVYVKPDTGPGLWVRVTDIVITGHSVSFVSLTDTYSAFTKADAIVTNNSTPDGLVESGATVDLSGNIVGNTLDLTTGLANHLDVNGHDIVSSSDGDINITPDGTGNVVIDGLKYPQADGTTGQVIATNGTGQLSFKTDDPGITALVDDTTPQLGGDLDVNGKSIVSVSDGDINIVPDGTGTVNGATPTEMGYLSGVSSAIQTQLNAKSPDFDGDQIFWVSSNGSDTLNNGEDDNKPFATFGKALTEARLLTPAAGNEFAIVCLEGGDFTEDLNIDSYCHLYAPNATINGQITVEANASVLVKNQIYSGTGVALTRSGGGSDQGHASVDFISCTSTGDAIENAGGNFEVNIDRVEVANGNGLQISGTSMTHTSGYINSVICVNSGNCIDVSGLNVLSFGMSFGRLNSDNATAISLTSNAKININVIEMSGTNAYVVNSATAELNLIVAKLVGNETVTLGTANVVNPSGNNFLNGTLKAASFEGATGNAVTGFSDDIAMAADSSTLGVTQHSVRTYISTFIAGLHWKVAVIDELDFTTAEPGSPSLGDRYINTVTGTSSGTAQSVTEDYIYEWNNVNWTEFATEEGDACYVDAQDTFKIYNGSSWITLNSIQSFLGLNDTFSAFTVAKGILANNATPDGVIQSTVTADASGNLGSVSTLNTVTWPAAGGSTADVLTLTTATTADWQAPSWLNNVVDDTSPQLGGNLDVNGHGLVSTSDGDIVLEPNGTGNVVLGGKLNTQGNTITSTTGTVNMFGTTAGGDVTIGTYLAGDVNIAPTQTGALNLNAAVDDLTYVNTLKWPVADGTNGQVLSTNGSKILSFVDPGDGIAAVVDDTTPQLGGNLDVNGHEIVSTSDGDISINPNGTGNVLLGGKIDILGNRITTTTGNIDIYGSVTGGNVVIGAYGAGNITLSPTSGNINVGTAITNSTYVNTFKMPTADGTNGQVLSTNGSKILSFTDAVGGISAVVDDTSPQLGGNLDVNGKDIVSVSNGDVKISPDGTGDIVLDGTIDTLGNSVTTTTGNTGIYGSSAGGDVTIASTNGGNVSINAQFGGGAGILNVGGAIDDTTYINTFTWPVADGTNGQVLTTNGSKVLSFTTAAGGVPAIPKNLLVSGDFSKIPLWIQSVGLTSYADATLVTPSFLILHNTTAQAERNNSFTDQNELVLQLTGSGYLGGYEPLYAAEFYSAFTELKDASETLSVGFFGRATGITQIKMDIIQWIPGTSAFCIKDPIAAWGATPTLDSDATGAWSYVASSSALTISGSNSIIKWEDISTASFNTSATRLGLVIRTAGTETSGDNIIIKKLAMHRGASFAGFEDRDEVTKTETRIACTYNFRVPKGATSQMASAIHSCFAYEVEPDIVHAAHFNYNTTLVEVPAIADVTVYNPVSGVAGQVEELDGSNITIETIDALSQHSISVLAEPDDGWSNNFKMHAIVWIKAYQ